MGYIYRANFNDNDNINIDTNTENDNDSITCSCSDSGIDDNSDNESEIYTDSDSCSEIEDDFSKTRIDDYYSKREIYYVNELQEEEIGLIPIIDGELWNVNPEWDKEGSAPLLHDKGAIGGLFRAMLGWNGDPTLLEFLTWASYLTIMGILVRKDTVPHTPAEEKEPLN